MNEQMTLFATDAEQRLAAWQARFERADWIAPWDCGDGTPKGTAVPGWRCPECRKVEPNASLLSTHHGLDPDIPDDDDPDGLWCRRLEYHRYRARNGLPELDIEPPLQCRCGQRFTRVAAWDTHACGGAS